MYLSYLFSDVLYKSVNHNIHKYDYQVYPKIKLYIVNKVKECIYLRCKYI